VRERETDPRRLRVVVMMVVNGGGDTDGSREIIVGRF
jgi:hypothetical protein